MQHILSASEVDDFIVATGESLTVCDFVQVAFDYVGLDYPAHVTIDPGILHRRNPKLIGNPAKLKRITRLKPTMVRWLGQGELDKTDG
jgi:GDPmannose 4,6-dehydratase